MSNLRAFVLKAFSDHLAAERSRSGPRIDRAAEDGVLRSAYATEHRIADAASALEAVPMTGRSRPLRQEKGGQKLG